MISLYVRIPLLIAVGILAWAAVWTTTPQPRAAYDTLWYSRFAFEYAGAGREVAIRESWQVFERFGDPDRVAYIAERDGWPWQGESDPSRRRWIGIYQMRPLMPLVTAAAYPWLSSGAPVFASVVSVVVATLATGLVLSPLLGAVPAGAFLILTLVNPGVSGWLVHLTTDGLGIALWLATMALAAAYVAGRSRWWLAAVFASAVLLAFTRQTASVLPLTFLLATMIAHFLGAQQVRRRFALLTLATVPALVIFTAYSALLGLPSFADMLQDAPTTHFARPNVQDPLGYILRTNLGHLPSVASALLASPSLWLSGALGILGYAMARRWWALPFLCAMVTLPLLQVAHPIMTEAPRTLAPMWISVHLGIVLLGLTVVSRPRRGRPVWAGLVGGEGLEPPTSSV